MHKLKPLFCKTVTKLRNEERGDWRGAGCAAVECRTIARGREKPRILFRLSFFDWTDWMENNGIEESWEIVNYCDLLEDDEDDEKTSKLGWILNAGLSLGKKIVITGFVISSAPIVFPPLVVISALGCALSLPFGVLFASYAFTDNLMTKLMPPSPRPLMLEYHYQTTLLPDDVDEFERVDFEEEADQKELVEMRIELVDDDNGKKSNLGGRDDEVIEVQYSKEKDDDELLLKNREDNVDVINLQVQTTDKFMENDENGDRVTEGDRPLLLQDNNKNEKMEKTVTVVKGTENESGNNNNNENEKMEKTVTVVKETENGSGKNVAADKKEAKNEKVEKTVVTVKGTAKKDAKGKSSGSKEIEKRGKRKNLSALKFPRKKKEEEKELVAKETENKLSTDESGSVSSDKVQPGDQVKKNIVLGNENKDNKQVSANDDDVKSVESSLEKEHKKPVAVKDSAMNGVSGEITDKSDTSTTTSVVAGEIANVDGGIDKKVEVSTATIYNDPAGGNYNQSETIADGVGDDSLEIAATTGIPAVSKHDEETPEIRGETKDSSLHSGEVMFGDDEKIWKKIDAIRVIVGYKAPRSPSYDEELKSLYLFTGIEPPSGSAEFQNKLCFLMSVIGLK